ncbi:MAG: hypothetical protein R3B09_20065 [Nannocystaceae bacterium]
MPRGRPRETDHCDAIAAILRDGVAMADIARQLELAYPLVARRVETMRRILAVETGEAAWIDPGLRTNVLVGRAWSERVAPA